MASSRIARLPLKSLPDIAYDREPHVHFTNTHGAQILRGLVVRSDPNLSPWVLLWSVRIPKGILVSSRSRSREVYRASEGGNARNVEVIGFDFLGYRLSRQAIQIAEVTKAKSAERARQLLRAVKGQVNAKDPDRRNTASAGCSGRQQVYPG
jgi:hypothetical protein